MGSDVQCKTSIPLQTLNWEWGQEKRRTKCWTPPPPRVQSTPLQEEQSASARPHPLRGARSRDDADADAPPLT